MKTEGPAPQVTVMFVEDDPVYATELCEFLADYSIKTIWLDTLADISGAIQSHAPNLLILDQFIGRRDAVSLLGDIRKTYDGGIVILTGNQDVVDRIVALETGADDFMSKQLVPRELLARFRAVLRRGEHPAHLSAPTAVRPPSNGKWSVDRRRATIAAPNREKLQITRSEFRLLIELVDADGAVVLREGLSQSVLGRPYDPSDRSVDNMVSRIRKAFAAHLGGAHSIAAVRGKGYAFVAFSLHAVEFL